MAFRVQVQIRLTGFEKYLDLPTLSIDPNDFFFGEFLIRASESYPIFLLVFVTNTHNLGRDLLLFANHNINRKNIFATATTFPTDSKDLFDIHHLAFVFITNTG